MLSVLIIIAGPSTSAAVDIPLNLRIQSNHRHKFHRYSRPYTFITPSPNRHRLHFYWRLGTSTHQGHRIHSHLCPCITISRHRYHPYSRLCIPTPSLNRHRFHFYWHRGTPFHQGHIIHFHSRRCTIPGHHRFHFHWRRYKPSHQCHILHFDSRQCTSAHLNHRFHFNSRRCTRAFKAKMDYFPTNEIYGRLGHHSSLPCSNFCC